jgi:hypothetical protein
MKKFLTREFAQKHIMEKHSDKVSAIESDVGMFNNYLTDPLRIRTVDIVPRLPMPAGGGGGGSGLAGGSPGMLQSPHMMRGPGGPRPVTSLPPPFFIRLAVEPSHPIGDRTILTAWRSKCCAVAQALACYPAVANY